MGKSGQKWPKIDKNGQKWPINSSFWSTYGQNKPTNTNSKYTDQEWPKKSTKRANTAWNGPKWPFSGCSSAKSCWIIFFLKKEPIFICERGTFLFSTLFSQISPSWRYSISVTSKNLKSQITEIQNTNTSLVSQNY